MDFALYANNALQATKPYIPKLAIAIVTLVIGLWIIGIIGKIALNGMKKAKIDVTLRRFLKSLIGVSLKILLIITVISMLGVEMTSFVAILAAAGFAVGLALQGSLGNFAGGVLIMIFKPYKVHDFIEAQGHMGTVEEIHIFNTVLKTPDNKTIIIPNGAISNGSITNFSTEKQRRVDFSFGIGYDDDFRKAKKVLDSIIKTDKRILKEPEPMIKVGELGDSSVNLTTRVWVEGKDYWDVFFDMHEAVKLNFDKNKIGIPYPQMDVHMKK